MDLDKTKIVVSINKPIQIGENEWKQLRIGKMFTAGQTITDMLAWASTEGIKKPTINDLLLLELKEE